MPDFFLPILCQSVTHFGKKRMISFGLPTLPRPLGPAQKSYQSKRVVLHGFTHHTIFLWKCMVPFEYEKLYCIVSKIYIMTFCCSNNFIGLETNSNLIKLNPSVGEHSKSKKKNKITVKIATVAARRAGTVNIKFRQII